MEKKDENLTFRDRRFPVQRQGFDLRIWHDRNLKKKHGFFFTYQLHHCQAKIFFGGEA